MTPKVYHAKNMERHTRFWPLFVPCPHVRVAKETSASSACFAKETTPNIGQATHALQKVKGLALVSLLSEKRLMARNIWYLMRIANSGRAQFPNQQNGQTLDLPQMVSSCHTSQTQNGPDAPAKKLILLTWSFVCIFCIFPNFHGYK
jgi:hypothetical protein